MSHLIKIYTVCKFSYFRLWYLKFQSAKKKADDKMYVCQILENVSTKLHHIENSITRGHTVQIQWFVCVCVLEGGGVYAVCRFNCFHLGNEDFIIQRLLLDPVPLYCLHICIFYK